MKKLITAAFFAVCSIMMAADVLVYDYKATIKRLDYNLRLISKSGKIAQKFTVKSDTIVGYVVLSKCNSCGGDIDSTGSYGNWNGTAYLQLKGNLKNVPASRKLFKTPVFAAAGIFGPENYTAGGEPMNTNFKAQMALDFVVPADAEIQPDFDPATVIKKLAAGDELLYNGFFGLLNFGAEPVLVQNTGFGAAKTFKSTTPGSNSICGGYIQGEEFVCNIVNTISGTLVGYPNYLGPCGNLPMWDLCVVQMDDGSVFFNQNNQAVISGSWNLKFNKTMTEAEDVEAAILKKLNLKAENMYVVQGE
jgi:hypothetical protein